MEDRWLSVAEIATYLGVTRDSIYRWVDNRNMPGHRVGRRWKFRKERIDRLLSCSSLAEIHGRQSMDDLSGGNGKRYE